MTAAAWMMMTVSVGTVLLLVGFCLYRVLSLPPMDQESIKGPLDIDTGDAEDAD